jgi:genome maintenance protein MGM101
MTTQQKALAPAQPQALAKAADAPAPLVLGYESASTLVLTPEERQIILREIEDTDIELREDGALYAPWAFYQSRLLEAFGPGQFTLHPRNARGTETPFFKEGDTVCWRGALFIRRCFVKEAVGECEVRWGMSYASAIEGAQSDCLVRCCKVLGIGQELFNPKWRRRWLNKYAQSRPKVENGRTILRKDGSPILLWSMKPEFAWMAATPTESVAASEPSAPAPESSPAPSADTAVSAGSSSPPEGGTAPESRLDAKQVNDLRKAIEHVGVDKARERYPNPDDADKRREYLTAARLMWLSQVVGRAVEKLSQLTPDEAARVQQAAAEMKGGGK